MQSQPICDLAVAFRRRCTSQTATPDPFSRAKKPVDATRWRVDNGLTMTVSVLNAANATTPQDQQKMEIAMASAYTLHRARQGHRE
jgi:hypothetical protein